MGADDKPKIRRRIFLVHEFQGAIVLRVIGLTTLFTVFVVAGLYWSYRSVSGLPLHESVRQSFFDATLVTGSVAILLLFAMGCYFVLLTHKVAGPAYALKRSILKLAAGEPNAKVKLRQGDYLQDLAEAFNGLSDLLHTRQEKWGAIVRKAEMLGDLQSRGEGASPKAADLVKSLLDDVRAEPVAK